MRSSLGKTMLGLTLAIYGHLAAAQPAGFPNQPIRIVIGFPPGGAIDSIARVMAPKMAADLGQNVIVDNRAGAGGVIGMGAVARAPADGYTLFMGTLGNFSITPALVPDLPYNVGRDFVPVSKVASASLVLFVNPRLPVKNVSDLIAYAKVKSVNFSSSGNGGLPHMAGEMFNAAANVKMTHVPYRGSAPSVTDLVGGQVDLTFEPAIIGMPHVNVGRLRALATTGTQRLSLMPDVPTVAETVPGYSVENWFGIAAPAGTPPDRVARIQKSIALALHQRDITATLVALGVEPVADTPAEFGAFIKLETERWRKLIVQNGIKGE